MKYRAMALACLLLSASGNSRADSEGDLDTAVSLINTKRFAEAATLLEHLSDSGDAAARYHLGGLVYRGQGVSRDPDRALALYTQASEAGHSAASQALRLSWPDAQATLPSNSSVAHALHAAAERGWTKELKALIDEEAGVDAEDAEGQTALMIASSRGHEKIVELLLRAGADTNAKDAGGETALHKAVRGGSAASMRALLNQGAQADAADSYGNTPLHFAARYEQRLTVEMLLSHTDNVNAENSEKLTALSLAARHDSNDIRALLRAAGGTSPFIARAAIQRTLQSIDRPVNGASLWFIAAERGARKILQSLLNGNQNIDQQDALGRSALAIAAGRGDEITTAMLLERGANASLPDNDGDTAMTASVRRSHLTTAKLLHDAGTRPDNRLLTAALTSGKPEVLDWALAVAGTNNNRSRQALPAAAQSAQEDLVLHLLRAGHAPDGIDETGRSALWHASGLGLEEAVRALLNAGANVEVTGPSESTPLHQAAATGHTAIVRLLLDAGARPDKENQQGLTPLMLATQYRQFGVIEQLYLGKADFDFKNRAGQTVLMLAALRNDARTAGVLLDFGATKKIVNRERRNAADIAERLGNDAVLALLESR